MYRNYKLCIILEEDESFNDLIEGVYQAFKEMEDIKGESANDSRLAAYKFVTLRDLLLNKDF